MGYLVKAGYQRVLSRTAGEKSFETGLVDYVAMDIKNSPEKYAETVGLNQDSLPDRRIRESVEYLLTERYRL